MFEVQQLRLALHSTPQTVHEIKLIGTAATKAATGAFNDDSADKLA